MAVPEDRRESNENTSADPIGGFAVPLVPTLANEVCVKSH
jgi:hypothetical protein